MQPIRVVSRAVVAAPAARAWDVVSTRPGAEGSDESVEVHDVVPGEQLRWRGPTGHGARYVAPIDDVSCEIVLESYLRVHGLTGLVPPLARRTATRAQDAALRTTVAQIERLA